jgi:hypothetical protein
VYARSVRQERARVPAAVAVRFEGLPGELLQIDWGEMRQMAFTRPALVGQTRYFFAARLKYSRYMWVRFTTDMQEETLLRCLIACLVALGGVPWVVNMKTITLGRDAQHQPIWHPTYQKLAVEFAFHPDACAPRAGNQKGCVENLVKFVKANFLAGRIFYDVADLAQECGAWLERVNTQRESDATERLPVELLAEERPRFTPLPVNAADYGLFDSVLVNRESLVTIATNRYSVPTQLVGQALTARIHPTRIDLSQGTTCVAPHPRHRGRNARVVVPEHFAAVFALKPRARIMVYRDWLVGLSASAAAYVSLLCQRRYAEMAAQIPALYELAQQVGREEFLAAVELALEHQIVGADYLRALLAAPASPTRRPAPSPAIDAPPLRPWAAPPQHEVERDLALYDVYVAQRQRALAGPSGGAR